VEGPPPPRRGAGVERQPDALPAAFEPLIQRACSLNMWRLGKVPLGPCLQRAIEETRPAGAPPSIFAVRDAFGTHSNRDHLASILARQWNAEAPDFAIDREPLFVEVRQFYLEQLSLFAHRLHELDLGYLFTPEWVAGIREDIGAWTAEDFFGTERTIPFITFLHDDDFLDDLAQKIANLHSQSDMAKRIRQRIQQLTRTHSGNVLGALFEINAVAPLISQPNELLELEPYLPDKKHRAEARIRVAGIELFVECAVLTAANPDFLHEEVFYYSSDGPARKIQDRLSAKATQLASTDLPVLLCFGLEIGYEFDAPQRAVREFYADSLARTISGICIADSFRCRRVTYFPNPSPQIFLPSEVEAWIQARAETWIG
jgi:hypothetical protein